MTQETIQFNRLEAKDAILLRLSQESPLPVHAFKVAGHPIDAFSETGISARLRELARPEFGAIVRGYKAGLGNFKIWELTEAGKVAAGKLL